jgi:hypothetical protein
MDNKDIFVYNNGPELEEKRQIGFKNLISELEIYLDRDTKDIEKIEKIKKAISGLNRESQKPDTWLLTDIGQPDVYTLDELFCWGETKEGFNFWEDIADNRGGIYD